MKLISNFLKRVKPIKPTNQMLNEKEYWQVIQRSLTKALNQKDQENYIHLHLLSNSVEYILGFHLRTEKLLFDLYNSNMWCASYIINGSADDDEFLSFRNWVISRGQLTYQETKITPDFLITELTDNKSYYDFKGFDLIAKQAFLSKTGRVLDKYISEAFLYHKANYLHIDINWKIYQAESMKKQCPNLFQKLWH
ncbi:MAG: hypothetical protein BM564_09195 [Bacteroidetes bacterium MedPE-SWsnd-G2]|nr:MAG: hypothetical protein BM564_09195 [Bacteroidetes bacterium MedPE-SWsnd-G2]